MRFPPDKDNNFLYENVRLTVCSVRLDDDDGDGDGDADVGCCPRGGWQPTLP